MHEMLSYEGIQGVCVCIQVWVPKLCVWRGRETWTPLELKEGQHLVPLGFYTVIQNLWSNWEGTKPLCRLTPPTLAFTGWLNLRHSRNRQLLHVSKKCINFCVPFSSFICKNNPKPCISFVSLFTCVGNRINYSELPNTSSMNTPQAKQWLQTLSRRSILWPLLLGLGTGECFLESCSVVVWGMVFSVPKNCHLASPSCFTCPGSGAALVTEHSKSSMIGEWVKYQ